jgi:hypothetical protein
LEIDNIEELKEEDVELFDVLISEFNEMRKKSRVLGSFFMQTAN